jgi:hypothetical protein
MSLLQSACRVLDVACARLEHDDRTPPGLGLLRAGLAACGPTCSTSTMLAPRMV